MEPRRIILAAAIGLAVLGAAVPLSGHRWDAVVAGVAGKGKSLVESLALGPETHKGTAGQAQQGSPPSVTVSQPLQRPIIEWDEYTGRFDATETVEVRARVSGYLTEVRFTDGQEVKEGDLLFVIDPRPFERALELAKAELDQARVKVQNSSLDVVRGRPLVERKIISEKVFDDRENILRDAEAAAKVAEARVRSAELELSFTRITAPVSGRISRTFITAGNFISVGGPPLTTIVKQDPIYIYFDVSENNAIKYRRLTENGAGAGAATVGARVGVALPDEQGFPTRASSTSSTTASMSAQAPCAPVPSSTTRRGCSRPACSHASDCRGPRATRFSRFPTRRSAPTSPIATSMSSARTVCRSVTR